MSNAESVVLTSAEKQSLRTDTVLMILLVAGSAVFQILWKDLVASAGGLGWDGYVYARVVQFPESIRHVIPGRAERAQRILPSMLISAALGLLHIPKTDPNIILSFQILNVCLLVSSVFAYSILCQLLSLNRATRWLGFFPLFFCFGTNKMSFYMPVSTDPAAFTLAMWAFVAAWKRKTWSLFLLILIASFTWSTFKYWFIPILLFPVRQATDHTENRTPPRNAVLLAMLPMLIYLAAVYISYNVKGYRMVPYGGPMLENEIPLSEMIGAIYVYAAFYFLFRSFQMPTFSSIRKYISFSGVLAAVAAVAVVKLVLMIFIEHQAPLIPYILFGPFIRSIAMPGIFIVSHIVYYGPIFFLILFFWNEMCMEIHKLGLGFVLFTMLTIFFSIDSESRHFLHTYPLLVLMCVAVIQKKNLQKILLPVVSAGTILSSKIWWRITLQMPKEYVQWGFLHDPLQRHFMHIGPWMTHRNYLLQGFAALICAAILYMCVWIGTRKSNPTVLRA